MAVVDLRAGRITAMIEVQTAVEEIFDGQILAGLRFPSWSGSNRTRLTMHLSWRPRASAPLRLVCSPVTP